MEKIKIGILPASNLFATDDPYEDNYRFVNGYIKKIIENDGIPVGILMADGKLNMDLVELCDAFLIPGGNKINAYVYHLIYYCIKKNKPLLGICLGSQALSIFSAMYERMDKEKDYDIDEMMAYYREIKEESEGAVLRKMDLPNMHANMELKRNNLDEGRHDIMIKNPSLLYSIFKQEKINILSMHTFDYKYCGEDFEITALAPDGVKEAIEFKSPDHFILGVHFHPEVEAHNLLFQALMNAAKEKIVS